MAMALVNTISRTAAERTGDVMNELINKVKKLVNAEIVLVFRETNDYGEVPNNDKCHDSFGAIHLIGHCEPEDAIWIRDLQDNYDEGLALGIRNTLKVLKDNPELLDALLGNS